ncbi:hypothetical protein [Pseudomonas aeruginosa]|uniref:hypothetical protein n=1 Tax=Pseudomonas aeruginosa TaxID=287 RepID=UPI00115F5F7F|nr:hypothetical protein [Pseudomonas aeruginosa]TRL54246.1 hypothetical protein FNL61_27610 [Pseudomonas aeruginosa]
MSITKSGSFSGVKPNERDSVPFHWKRTQLVPDISWKYHHIIPWQTLRDTWQALLMCDYWKGCVLYVKVIGVVSWGPLISRLMNAQMTQEDCDELYAKLSWPAWNIVEGPADRDDEGGTDLDLFRHGLQGTEPARMQALQRLYDAMEDFLSLFNRREFEATRLTVYNPRGGAPAVDEAHREALHTALQGMLPYKDQAFIPYRPEMWIVTLEGREHRKYPTWLRTPRYKKADGSPPKAAPHAVEQTGLTQCPKCGNKFRTNTAVQIFAEHRSCPRCGTAVYVAKHAFKDPTFP